MHEDVHGRQKIKVKRIKIRQKGINGIKRQNIHSTSGIKK
jgi:hypothetical protein